MIEENNFEEGSCQENIWQKCYMNGTMKNLRKNI